MNSFVSVLVATMLVSCATTPEVETSAREPVYLPRIVAIDGQTLYPDPLSRAPNAPDSLGQAVDELARALPLVPLVQAPSSSCRFTSLDEVDLGLGLCIESACNRLPATSREKGCGYLVRLAEWTEQNWLGGLCRTTKDLPGNKLVRWFEARGIHDCHLMSVAISIALAQELIRDRQKTDELLLVLASRN